MAEREDPCEWMERYLAIRAVMMDLPAGVGIRDASGGRSGAVRWMIGSLRTLTAVFVTRWPSLQSTSGGPKGYCRDRSLTVSTQSLSNST